MHALLKVLFAVCVVSDAVRLGEWRDLIEMSGEVGVKMKTLSNKTLDPALVGVCCGRKLDNSQEDFEFVSFKVKQSSCDTSGMLAEVRNTAHKWPVSPTCCSGGLGSITPMQASNCNAKGVQCSQYNAKPFKKSCMCPRRSSCVATKMPSRKTAPEWLESYKSAVDESCGKGFILPPYAERDGLTCMKGVLCFDFGGQPWYEAGGKIQSGWCACTPDKPLMMYPGNSDDDKVILYRELLKKWDKPLQLRESFTEVDSGMTDLFGRQDQEVDSSDDPNLWKRSDGRIIHTDRFRLKYARMFGLTCWQEKFCEDFGYRGSRQRYGLDYFTEDSRGPFTQYSLKPINCYCQKSSCLLYNNGPSCPRDENGFYFDVRYALSIVCQ